MRPDQRPPTPRPAFRLHPCTDSGAAFLRHSRPSTAVGILAGLAWTAAVLAQAPQPITIPEPATQPVEELTGVGIEEKLGDQLPLELEFLDEDGRRVRLGDYFRGQRPVLLTTVYYGCPMLCGLILNGQMEAMKALDWTPGQAYEVVTVSFDPRETPALARLKKQNYIKAMERPEAAAGWHFLTGPADSIARLTDAIGFRYRWIEREKQFAHAAALVVCTPEGRVSRYLYGVQFAPRTLRLSLVEASEGRVGSTMDHVLLYCLQYDPRAGRYGIVANRFMTAGAALTVLVMAVWLVPRWVGDARRRAASPPAAA